MGPASQTTFASSIRAGDRHDSDSAISWQRILGEARLYWPRNTAKHISGITGASVRTCYRWLADDAEPSAGAIVTIVTAMRAEYRARGRIFEQFDLNL